MTMVPLPAAPLALKYVGPAASVRSPAKLLAALKVTEWLVKDVPSVLEAKATVSPPAPVTGALKVKLPEETLMRPPPLPRVTPRLASSEAAPLDWIMALLSMRSWSATRPVVGGTP